MRYCLDCRCVFAGCGGIGNYARSLVRALASLNDYDEFILLRTSGKPGDPLTSAPNFREWHVSAAMIDPDWEQLQLPSLLEEMRVDLYHNPTFALPLVKPCSLVTTIHDVVFEARPDLVAPSLCAYLQGATRRAAQVADHIITGSHHSAACIRQAYDVPPERISVICDAVDHEVFFPAYRGTIEAEFRARHDIRGRYVLYVGSLEPKKNIDYLLQAYHKLRQEWDDEVLLVLAGSCDAAEYDIVEALEAFAVRDATVVTGFLPDRYLPAAYAAATAFVYPSVYEGFGLPPLEAMATGTPVLVARATSLPEVVGDAGLYADPDDPDDLAQQLRLLLSDEDLRHNLSVSGRERARQFQWALAAVDTLDVYHRVMAGATA